RLVGDRSLVRPDRAGRPPVSAHTEAILASDLHQITVLVEDRGDLGVGQAHRHPLVRLRAAGRYSATSLWPRSVSAWRMRAAAASSSAGSTLAAALAKSRWCIPSVGMTWTWQCGTS